MVTGLSDDFSLEGGSFLGGTGAGRQWLVSPADLNAGNVSVVADKNFNGKIDLTVKAVTTENDGTANPNAASETLTLTVTPSPEADMHDGKDGQEDTPVQLDFGVKHHDGDTDEYISSVWIDKASADTAGVTFTEGSGGPALTEDNGWYKIDQADLNNIYAKGPANEDGDITFNVQYKVTDPGKNGVADQTITKNATYTLHLDPITDDTATALDNFVTDAHSSVSGNTVTATGETTFSFDVTVTQQNDTNATGNTPDTESRRCPQ